MPHKPRGFSPFLQQMTTVSCLGSSLALPYRAGTPKGLPSTTNRNQPFFRISLGLSLELPVEELALAPEPHDDGNDQQRHPDGPGNRGGPVEGTQQRERRGRS